MFVAGIDAHTTYLVVAVVSKDGALVEKPVRIHNAERAQLVRNMPCALIILLNQGPDRNVLRIGSPLPRTEVTMTRRATVSRPASTLAFPLLALLATSSAPGLVPALVAQAGPDRAGWTVPRTPSGHPDLQGNWTNATLTPFQRAEGRAPVFTPEEVREIEAVGEDGCPASPGTVACGRSVVPEGADASVSNEAFLSGREYSEFYWDRGSRVAIVNGEPRSSLLTRPSNGRRPPLTDEAQRRIAERREFRSQFGPYDHPEVRPLAERCVVSFGMSVGPPMVPNSAYNNNYTIVQTPDHILMMAEMVHDTRIIRLGDADPLPAHITPWFGDSRGHWEGDVLVVETTNLNPEHPFRGIRPTEYTKVTERFTRVSEETILYDFTIEDPTTYTEAWGGEIPFNRQRDRVYEYACHEGNYSLEGVLRGARWEEREGG